MKIVYKVITFSVIINFSMTYTLNAKELKSKDTGFISKASKIDCKKISIEDPYSTYKVVLDKEGKPRCSAVRSTARPHCPEGYAVLLGKCSKLALK